MPITTTAREALDAMYEFMAAEIGQDPRNMVNIDPEKAQTIETKLMQDNAFLSQINNQPVDAVAGEVLAFGVPNTITKRTNTAQGDGSLRRPTDPTSLVARRYYCRELEQDALMTWKKIDRWAHVADFYAKFRESVRFARQRDILLMMWNGQKSVENTDPIKYPLLQDTIRGFPQYLIEAAPEQVFGIRKATSGASDYENFPVYIGAGAKQAAKDDSDPDATGFENLDEAVTFLKDAMIDRLFRRRKSLRALIGDDLLVSERARLLGIPDVQPSEHIASKLLIKESEVGGIQYAESDELPPRIIFISELTNLSHYWLEDSVRTKYDENHDKKGVVNYYYKECDNVVEIPEASAMIHPDSVKIRINGSWEAASGDDKWKIDV